MLRLIGIVLLANTLGACGQGPGGNVAVRLAWTLDYADWTLPGAPAPDLRACDNRPLGSPARPAYDAVHDVRVSLRDPSGTTRPIDEVFACDAGAERGFVAIRALDADVYVLAVTARNAEGTVLYRHDDEDFRPYDAPTDRTLPLRAAVGELEFFPLFGTSGLTCPDNAETVRYGLTKTSADGVETKVQGTHPACEGSASAAMVIRNIPTDPPEGSNGNYRAETYTMTLEALDTAGAVQFCSVSDRVVSPGKPNLRHNPRLVAGNNCGQGNPL